ncbi:Transmembrane amino acid transporter protein [Tritrichomonas foetus]|uniref:Transmembrane amino acid transporter protein n=1 Tax=Tritrichomonas foetus TaxID=1144522 RepID=A0A1J4KD96_9EUKA|nr:Transmembrane amino acid transporter protein [Tritrichomonas foetus]|eukprot:OHT09415.1 Transmembrane amino acid transporter protein [Tritrichomonas foetus]
MFHQFTNCIEFFYNKIEHDSGMSNFVDYTNSIPSQLSTNDEIFESKKDYQSFPIALLNLLNTLIGPEILGVANSMIFCGLTISTVLLMLTAVLSYIGTIFILNLQHMVQAESINDMATKIYGRWAGQLFSGITLFFTFSNQISYLIVGQETICSWLTLGGLESWTTGWRRSLVVLVYSLVLPVALTIPRQMEFIDTASMFAIVAQLTFVGSMIYKGANYFGTQGQPIHPTCETGIINLNFFNAFSIYSTLFALPAVVLPQLEPFTPKLKPRYWLLGTAFVMCFTIDIIPSAIGYLMFGSTTDQILYSSFEHNDILMQVVRGGFFFVVNAAYPIVALMVMTDVGSMIYNQHNPRELPWGKRIICLLISNSLPVLVAMVMPKVRPIFEIGGSFGGCLSNFFFPPILYWKQLGRKWYDPMSIGLLLFALWGFVAMVVATAEAVIDAIETFKTEGI